MLYKGYFKNLKEESILVEIITGSSTENDSTVTDLVFSGEDPVIISTASDGLFSPIKSRSCTVSLISEQPYFDMYSGGSQDVKLHVYNCDTAECLFWGYVTPCVYSQDYNSKYDIIEIEAVDAVSTLQDYKFEYVNGSNPSITEIVNIVKDCFEVAGYPGRCLIPYFGHKPESSEEHKKYPTEEEMINDDTFFEDNEEHEPMSLFDVLTEICNFYGFSCVPHGEDLWFIDYEAISQISGSHKWKDVITNKEYTLDDIGISVVMNDYAGDGHSIEMDEVYNKASVKADIQDIESDDILTDLYDESDRFKYDMFWSNTETLVQNKNKELNNTTTRYYTIPYNNSYEYHSQSNNDYHYPISEQTEWWFRTWAMNGSTGRFDVDASNYFVFPPYTTEFSTSNPYHGLGNTLAAAPSQYFIYDSTKAIPIEDKWEDVITFHPQMPKWKTYIDNNRMYGIYTAEYYWENEYQNNITQQKPVMGFHSKQDFNFSPPNTGYNGFFILNCQLAWPYANDGLHMVSEDGYGSNVPPTAYSAKELVCKSRENTNKGWSMLKVSLRVGNKYWTPPYEILGAQYGTGNWSYTPSTFYLPFHKEDVNPNGGKEVLSFNVWNKIVTNHNYTDGIYEDGYAIPVTPEDNLWGEVVLEIYCPRIPYKNQLKINGTPAYYYLNDDRDVQTPYIYMKDLSLQFKMVKQSNYIGKYEYISDDDSDDDIIYENVINSRNVQEMDELSLKISTYNKEKPFAKNYIVKYNNSGSKVVCTEKWVDYTGDHTYRTNGMQEYNIIEKYVNHYSKPKLIYECTTHKFFDPFNLVDVSSFTNRKFVVDSQEWNIKTNSNTSKLIEY